MRSRIEGQRPSQDSPLIASIDTGSNTIRFLVGYCNEGRVIRLFSHRRITRLGDSIKETGTIKNVRMIESVECLKDFKEIASQYGVSNIIVVGTQALREALNSGDFIDMVKKEAGLDVRVISPEEEAYLTIEGIKAGMDLPSREPIIAFDLGGGSTEFIIIEDESTRFFSIPVGVLKLSTFIYSYPPSRDAIDDIVKSVRKFLNDIPQLKDSSFKKPLLIGTGGTVTTIAGIDLGLKTYEPDRIHGHRISLARLKEIFDSLSTLSLEDLKTIDGLEPGREDIIIPGIVGVIEILSLFSEDLLVVSDYGILEGIIKYGEEDYRDKR